MSDTSDTALKKTAGARVSVRVSERELAALRELAEERDEDLTRVIREAIGAYLARERDDVAHRAEHQRLAAEVSAQIKREADRVIERHDQTTRALIAALNEHLAGRPAGQR